jgi:DNA gyrase subunit A
MTTRAEDLVSHLFVASTHSYLMSSPQKDTSTSSRCTKYLTPRRLVACKAIVNLINLPGGQQIAGVIPVRQFEEGLFVVMVTRLGVIKKTELPEFANIRANGIIAMASTRTIS